MANWREIESRTFRNAEINLLSQSEVVTEPNRCTSYNGLLVQNTSSNCDIEIRLDGMTTSGKVFIVPSNGGSVLIEPDDSIYFKTVWIYNRDGASNLTAGDVVIRAWRSVRVR